MADGENSLPQNCVTPPDPMFCVTPLLVCSTGFVALLFKTLHNSICNQLFDYYFRYGTWNSHKFTIKSLILSESVVYGANVMNLVAAAISASVCGDISDCAGTSIDGETSSMPPITLAYTDYWIIKEREFMALMHSIIAHELFDGEI